MEAYRGTSRKVWKIADKPFAGGGEGDVYNVIGSSTEVAKIFNADKRTTERERKLLAMIEIKPSVIDQYSWPLDVLYDNGKLVGYIMPKVVGKEKLRDIYVYDKRKGNPWTLYIAIAKNLSSAVHSFHDFGQVIGDLNPENILVDPKTGLVTLIDTDSYHITDASGRVYRCGVGMPEYIAAELQGKHFPSAPLPTFTQETDLFSLGVLLFCLLMNGAHPFACKTVSGSSSRFQPIDNLTSGICAYFAESSAPNIEIPRYAPAIASLPKELQDLFKRAFVDGHKNPKRRPTAEEYYHALGNLENNIKVCGVNTEHLYYCYASECPWCKVEQKMKTIGQTAFSPGSIPSGPAPSLVSPNPPQPRKRSWWIVLAGIAAMIGCLVLGGSVLSNVIGGTQDPTRTPLSTPTPLPTQVRQIDNMIQIWVPGGTYRMGTDDHHYASPAHEVTLDGFWLDQTEVTSGMYRLCVDAGECEVSHNCGGSGTSTYWISNMITHPMTCVSWHEAESYCQWVGGRLPTEAEWEYAARGPNGYKYPWGNSWREKYGNCNAWECDDQYTNTSPVGAFPAGASWVNAQDMMGNVWEWVGDWYGDFSSSPQTNPVGPDSGQTRVLKGGSWHNGGGSLRSDMRYWEYPSARQNNIGFRCVSSADQ